MKTKFRHAIFFALIAAALIVDAQGVSAQEFKWAMRFDTKFDNREYDAVKREGIIKSQTLFSVRLVPLVGIGWAENHSVMGGGSFTFDMGARLDKRDPEVVLYYNYHSPKYSMYAGKFERRMLIGSYSRAIYAGSHSFYDNVIDGFAFQYTPGVSKLEFVLDWDGMQSPTIRESFRILSAGEINPVNCRPVRWLTAGYSLDVYHLASSADATEGVVDHILANPWAGVAFERLAPWFEKLTLQVGWLWSFDRERRGENVWNPASGVTVDFTIQKWDVGIRNRLYIGDKQFAFWRTYGSRIYRGDQFYAVSGVYNYTQIYWRPNLAQGVTLDLEMGLHSDGHGVGFQPVVWVGVSLDSGMFKKDKNKRKKD